METYNILKVTFIPRTETKPHKVKIRSEWNQKSVTISQTEVSALSTAIKYLQEISFELVGKGGEGKHQYLISTTFRPLK